MTYAPGFRNGFDGLGWFDILRVCGADNGGVQEQVVLVVMVVARKLPSTQLNQPKLSYDNRATATTALVSNGLFRALGAVGRVELDHRHVRNRVEIASNQHRPQGHRGADSSCRGWMVARHLPTEDRLFKLQWEKWTSPTRREGICRQDQESYA